MQAFSGYVFFISVFFVVGAYWLLPARLRPLFLLLTSLGFYLIWDFKYSWILPLTTLVDFTSARVMERKPGIKKTLVITSIAMNVGVLAYFKYAAFFAKSIKPLFPALEALQLHWLVPLGISFYTFHSISYVVDVYRGKTAAIRSIVDYALYVSYFPKLISGPVERAEQFAKERAKAICFSQVDWEGGLQLLLYGLFLKLVVSHNLQLFVSGIFAKTGLVAALELYFGMCANSFYIYSDFLAYTCMARGISKWFGIELEINFNAPYMAASVKEFWRRWHISLSSWFRDYVYLPLGGNRHDAIRNVLITFLLAGLWHGAAANFLVWGAYHGIGHVVSERAGKLIRLPKWLSVLFTFHFVSVGWIFFRTADLPSALLYLKRMFLFCGGESLGIYLIVYASFFLAAWYVVGRLLKFLQLPYGRAFTAGIVLLMIMIFGSSRAIPFLYFRF